MTSYSLYALFSHSPKQTLLLMDIVGFDIILYRLIDVYPARGEAVMVGNANNLYRMYSFQTVTSFIFHFSLLKSIIFSMCSSSVLSLSLQLVSRPHGGLGMSLYLLSSCCFTCRSVLQGDSSALAWMNTFHSSRLCCVHYPSQLSFCVWNGYLTVFVTF